MWDRQELRGEAVEIFRATRPTKITIWAVRDVSENQVGSMVFLCENRERCSPAKGAPLQVGITVKHELVAGEAVYGITEDVGLVGYVTRPL
jgi:hypothetical protein